MSYSKQEWISQATVITANRMNHIEEGIFDVDGAVTTEATSRETADTALSGRITTNETEITKIKAQKEILQTKLNEFLDILPQGTSGPSGAVSTSDAGNMGSKELTVTVEAKQASGTPTSSSAKAISGHTGLKLYHSDQVFLDFQLPDVSGTTLSDISVGITSGNHITLIGESSETGAELQLTLVNEITIPANTSVYVSFYDPSVTGNVNVVFKNSSSQTLGSGSLGGIIMFESETQETLKYVSLVTTEGTSGEPVTVNITGTLLLTYGDTAPTITEYEFDWTEEVGTVYGGVLDVENGTLTVTYGVLDITKETVGYTTGTFENGTYGNRYGFNLTSGSSIRLAGSTANFLCNIATTDSNINRNNYKTSWQVDTCVLMLGGGNDPASWFRYIFPTTMDDGTDAIEYLEDAGCKITYPLNPPVVYSITPAHIKLLQGTNGLSSSGNKVYLRYCKDLSGILN